LRGDNLARQLVAAGETFVGHSEGLPGAGATDCTAGSHARKHNPWVNFPDLPEEINQPYSALPDDYADLPTVSVVVPDLCHDMHDCGVAAGDQWASEQLPGYVDSVQTHDSLLVVTWDESEGRRDDNLIPTFLVGPMVQAGDTAQRIDHYSILRTIEDMYALHPSGRPRTGHPSGTSGTPRRTDVVPGSRRFQLANRSVRERLWRAYPLRRGRDVCPSRIRVVRLSETQSLSRGRHGPSSPELGSRTP
jgi:hypothetical protein